MADPNFDCTMFELSHRPEKKMLQCYDTKYRALTVGYIG